MWFCYRNNSFLISAVVGNSRKFIKLIIVQLIDTINVKFEYVYSYCNFKMIQNLIKNFSYENHNKELDIISVIFIHSTVMKQPPLAKKFWLWKPNSLSEDLHLAETRQTDLH